MAHTLTRQQAAGLLGVSESTIRRREAEGRLNPVQDENGVWRHDEKEALRLAQSEGRRDNRSNARVPADTQGSVALPNERRADRHAENPELLAKVFEMLERGDQPNQIVIQLGLTPEQIETHYMAWERLRNLEVDGPSGAERLDEYRFAVETLNTRIVRHEAQVRSYEEQVCALRNEHLTALAKLDEWRRSIENAVTMTLWTWLQTRFEELETELKNEIDGCSQHLSDERESLRESLAADLQKHQFSLAAEAQKQIRHASATVRPVVDSQMESWREWGARLQVRVGNIEARTDRSDQLIASFIELLDFYEGRARSAAASPPAADDGVGGRSHERCASPEDGAD